MASWVAKLKRRIQKRRFNPNLNEKSPSFIPGLYINYGR